MLRTLCISRGISRGRCSYLKEEGIEVSQGHTFCQSVAGPRLDLRGRKSLTAVQYNMCPANKHRCQKPALSERSGTPTHSGRTVL